MNTFCGHYNAGVCRSCTRIELPLSEQLTRKTDVIRKSLQLQESQVLPAVPSPEQHFRNKAKLVVTGTIENPIIGLSGETNLDDGRELLTCTLHHPRINELLTFLKGLITEAKLPPYQISARRGELKGIIIFLSGATGEMSLRFVLRSLEATDRLKKLLPMLQGVFPELTCISANIQPVPHALLEGEKEVFLTETTTIRHQVAGITLRLDPRAFVQTNEAVAEKLFTTAASWVRELKVARFSELFCGQGAFSFAIADAIASGLGVEINESAVEAARHTALANGLSHLRFEASDAAHVSSVLKAFSPDLVLVNPPRRGLAQVLEVVRDGQWKHLIYSSCSHETLAEDAKNLSDDFEILRAQVFDMFPHTDHFETLVLFRRKT